MMLMRMSYQLENNSGGPELATIAPALRQLNPVKRYFVKLISTRSTEVKGGISRSRSLTALLRTCTDFQATDERDKIFGLLSIVTHGSDFIPDYSLSVRDVYVNVTKHIITSTKSLEILETAGIGMIKRRPDLPSWVPDFAFLGYGQLGLFLYLLAAFSYKSSSA